jgi:hypothetical protein
LKQSPSPLKKETELNPFGLASFNFMLQMGEPDTAYSPVIEQHHKIALGSYYF